MASSVLCAFSTEQWWWDVPQNKIFYLTGGMIGIATDMWNAGISINGQCAWFCVCVIYLLLGVLTHRKSTGMDVTSGLSPCGSEVSYMSGYMLSNIIPMQHVIWSTMLCIFVCAFNLCTHSSSMWLKASWYHSVGDYTDVRRTHPPWYNSKQMLQLSINLTKMPNTVAAQYHSRPLISMGTFTKNTGCKSQYMYLTVWF